MDDKNPGGRPAWLNNPGRQAGLLYLLGTIPGLFGLLYVPGKLLVHGDPLATAHHMAAGATLFRSGIFADLAGQTIFIFVAFSLYQLFKKTGRRQALVMLILLLVSIPIAFLTELCSLAALTCAQAPVYLQAFDEPKRVALMRLFLNLRSEGFNVDEIFWGLWLFPLGLLVFRCDFLPRILGVLLMIGCLAWLTSAFTALVLPSYQDGVTRWTNPLELVEMIFMVWLIVMGARPKAQTG